jgi:hypothetical protein
MMESCLQNVSQFAAPRSYGRFILAWINRVPHSTDGLIVRRACPELAEGVGREDAAGVI